ncbi:DNA primase [Desulfovibrio sp. An276]|uniref:DNA primase n=1 Tax=Desulfovibrio sp. An276 TaxID=1965618 RepID=UPI000B3B075E|nr:DNA primase [Desulfovibrio sp. An276]OUO54191.1 DNA primase [Desulfovibrio sp. An276]
MDMAANDAVELIKQRISIVDLIGRYIPLRQMGNRFVAPCPFHQETKPSFNVTPDGRFYCFGCQKSGDIFTFMMEYHGLSFRDALEQLSQEAGVDLAAFGPRRQHPGAARQKNRKKDLLLMYRLAQGHFVANLEGPDGAACRKYMAERGISPELARRFGLGWAKDGWHDLASFLQAKGCDLNLAMEGGLLGKSSKTGKPYDPFRARLMFPIRNTGSETIAFGGRIIDKASDAAKYINSQDSPIYKKGEHLYGLDLAAKAIRVNKKVYLTEGYMDVLTLHQYGFENSVGGLGTALTDQQVQRILGYGPQVNLLYDGDNAGRKAAMAAATKFLSRGASVKVILQPEGEDIDTLLRGKGPDFFRELCDKAMPGLRFCVETLYGVAPRDALEWCRTFIRGMQIPELVSPTISYLSRWLNFDEQSLRDGLVQDMSQAPRANQAQDKAISATLPHIEREILRTAIRYPGHARDIRDMGADILLKSPMASALWNKILEQGENAGYELEGEARTLWDRHRGLEAPPCKNPEAELGALKKILDKYLHSIQKSSFSALLRQSDAQGDYSAGMHVLDTLQEPLSEPLSELKTNDQV